LEQQAAESQKEARYRIISFSGIDLPKNYEAVVYSRFLRGLRYGNVLFRLIESRAYHRAYHQYIEMLLHRPNTTVRLAVLEDDHDNVLGYAIVEPGVLHWVAVHKLSRRNGIAKALVPRGIQAISHLTNTGFKIWNEKLKHTVAFNPFI
jgi:GNAT superfamily N-acetyltransferase